MSGRYRAARGWVVAFEKVREFAPAAMAKFEAAVEAYDSERDEGDAIHDLEYDDVDGIDIENEEWSDGERLEATYKDVQAVVMDATGLRISAFAHDGDATYEDEDLWPCFWCENVEIITAPGRRAIDAKLIENTGWVTYG